MSMQDDEIPLQPIDPHIVERAQCRVRQRIDQATAHLELERICADADAGDELTMAAVSRRFGIRHIILGTALTAFVLTFFKAGGMIGGMASLPVAVLVAVWLLVREREQNHARRIEQRLREFERKHHGVLSTILDVDRRWKHAARDARGRFAFSTQHWMLGATALALLIALSQGSSPILAAIVLSAVIVVVRRLRYLDRV